MLSADETKKPGRRARKNKAKITTKIKAAQPHPAGADQPQVTAPEVSQEPGSETDHEGGALMAGETAAPEGPTEAPTKTLPVEESATEITAAAPAARAEQVPVTAQTIANAYGDFTKASLEHAWSFFGKLAAARSPAEVFEVQMAFAKEATETFVAESQKIAELHGQLARQRAKHLEGVAARITQTTFELGATRH